MFCIFLFDKLLKLHEEIERFTPVIYSSRVFILFSMLQLNKNVKICSSHVEMINTIFISILYYIDVAYKYFKMNNLFDCL